MVTMAVISVVMLTVTVMMVVMVRVGMPPGAVMMMRPC
jgi:hypothetical protein